MNQPISKHLKRFRSAALIADSKHLFWVLYSILILLLGVFIISESTFYFSSDIRFSLWVLVSIFFNLGLLLIIFLSLMILFNRLHRFRLKTLAKKIGVLAFSRGDAVINALQLERTLTQSASPELSAHYIKTINDKLHSLNASAIFSSLNIRRWKLRSLVALVLVSTTVLVSWDESHGAIYRLLHPRTHFPAPTPFSLKSTTGDINLLGGDPTTISILSQDAEPDTVYLQLTTDNEPKSKIYTAIQDSNGQYNFHLTEIFSDYTYQAFVPSTHFWEPWERVETDVYNILVTDRPLLEDFSITVISPKYSQLEPKIHSGNQANIQGLLGSRISIQFKANRKLGSGYILFNNENIPLDISGNYASVQFPLDQEGKFTIHFADERGINNRDPIPYHLQILPDASPNMTILSPERELDLGSDQAIPLHLKIEDDFGFSNLQVGYELRRPSYLELEPYISIFSVHIRDPYLLSQDIQSFWALDDLGLMPEDEIHFHFELYDNDIISGPKKYVSETFIARVPSLADLYEKMEEEQTELLDYSQVNLEEVQQLQDQIESSRLELLKSENLNWEQRQEIEKILEKTSQEIQKLQKLNEQLQAMEEFGEKHGLLNQELIQKFQELQQLLSDIISEDLFKSMEDMQQALDSMNMEDLQSAMENLASNMEQMEENLDRYLDIFKRIQAEQKLDEVLNRLAQLEEQQDILDERIDKTDSDTDKSTFARLEQEENWNVDELEKIRETMKEAADAMEEFSSQASESLEELESSDLSEQTQSDLEETIDQLANQNSQQAQQSSQMALQDIQSLRQQAQMIQQQFQQQTGMEMAAEFQSVLRDVLAVSKSQETLSTTTNNTPRNSPRMRDLAAAQQQLKDQVAQIMSALMELSRETFAVTPEIGQMMGKSFASMDQATQSITERNTREAGTSQSTAMEALNQAAMALHQTAQNMQSGQSSASGYEQFLKQMQQMAGQQQGLNQQGMQLAMGQMASSLQQSLMQRMMAGQQQVRKSLQEMMNEMTGSSKGQKGLGDLSGIAKEMDEVIKDLQRKRFTRKTQERQQRILSRMLDSQKSLMQRGEKEDRKSTAASQFIPYTGPGGLPADMGQRRSLTLEALNEALKAGYSSDYQDMIRRYFNTLTEDINSIENLEKSSKENDG